MKNRNVGLIIIAISLLIGFIVFMFNRALSQIVAETCSHGPTCPMWGTIDFQTNIGLGLMGFIIIIGLYFLFSKDEFVRSSSRSEKSLAFDEGKLKAAASKLHGDEKKVFETVLGNEGTIFQSDLVEKTNLSKVKVTRLLDRLEGQGLIERKRRGMTNVVILKR